MSPCSFKREGPSHLLNYTSPITGNSHFEKERTDVLALSTISTLSLSFLFLPCHKFPPLLSNHAFPKRLFFWRQASFPARKAAIIFSCQLRVIRRSTGCAVQYWRIFVLLISSSSLIRFAVFNLRLHGKFMSNFRCLLYDLSLIHIWRCRRS